MGINVAMEVCPAGFQRRFVLAPADKAANNIVVVWKRYHINTFTLKDNVL